MSDNWKTLGNQFAENYEVHLIDQRNHGRSFHSNDFDYELLVEDVYAYIQQYNLKKIIIICGIILNKNYSHFKSLFSI